jgi:DNA polymerase/3'-5' exonuclease PolX
MELNRARGLAEGIKKELAPFCHRIEVAGSIRRGKADVHDIDIVCIPISQEFYTVLNGLGNVSGGPKIYKLEVKQDGRPVITQGKAFCADIYIATRETWATLLLIRTGPKEFNIKLCRLAQSKGMKLHADGSGLEKCLAGQGFFEDVKETCKIPCATETDIFEALGLKYRAPGERG